MSLLIKNANVVLPGASEPCLSSLLIEEGQIAGIGSGFQALETIEADGLFVFPAMFDMHVHLREPGGEDRETIESGTEAAINGGITGVLAMPNTNPPIDTGGMVTFVQNMAANRARIPVSVAGCLTVGRRGEKLAEIGDMVQCGAVMVTDCNHALQDSYILRRALEYTRHFDVILGVYPDTPALSRGGVMNEGKESFARGLRGIPSMAEEIGIEHDCRIAEATGGRIHIQNVSTAGGVASIRRFKDAGVRVTAEVTPHHLLLEDRDLGGYDTSFKMMPPLRTGADREALLAGLKDGTLDVIATGHAPHTLFDKHMDFHHAPFGVTGLETALLSLYEHLILPGKLSWSTLIERFALAPRELLGLPSPAIREGAMAQLVIFDPNASTQMTRENMKSLSINSPWLGQELRGSVRAVIQGNNLLKADMG